MKIENCKLCLRTSFALSFLYQFNCFPRSERIQNIVPVSKLLSQLSKKVPSKRIVRWWFQKFRRGNENFEENILNEDKLEANPPANNIRSNDIWVERVKWKN